MILVENYYLKYYFWIVNFNLVGIVSFMAGTPDFIMILILFIDCLEIVYYRGHLCLQNLFDCFTLCYFWIFVDFDFISK